MLQFRQYECCRRVSLLLWSVDLVTNAWLSARRRTPFGRLRRSHSNYGTCAIRIMLFATYWATIRSSSFESSMCDFRDWYQCYFGWNTPDWDLLARLYLTS